MASGCLIVPAFMDPYLLCRDRLVTFASAILRPRETAVNHGGEAGSAASSVGHVIVNHSFSYFACLRLGSRSSAGFLIHTHILITWVLQALFLSGAIGLGTHCQA